MCVFLTSSNSYQKARDKNKRCWLFAREKPLSPREENPFQISLIEASIDKCLTVYP